MMMGWSHSLFKCSMTRQPRMAPMKVPGRIRFKRLMSTLPARQNCQALMTAPKVAENLLVPMARCGGRPAAKRTGSEMRPPPPAMESTKPARKPPAMMKSSSDADRVV